MLKDCLFFKILHNIEVGSNKGKLKLLVFLSGIYITIDYHDKC
jgi:hypothetical protein